MVPAKQNYHITEQELLAMIEALRAFFLFFLFYADVDDAVSLLSAMHGAEVCYW